MVLPYITLKKNTSNLDFINAVVTPDSRQQRHSKAETKPEVACVATPAAIKKPPKKKRSEVRGAGGLQLSCLLFKTVKLSSSPLLRNSQR